MKLVVNRFSMEIVPESPTDVAYIEEVFGLKSDGDWVRLVRDKAGRLRAEQEKREVIPNKPADRLFTREEILAMLPSMLASPPCNLSGRNDYETGYNVVIDMVQKRIKEAK